eukprot:TRINITY_DN49517_c0_g1_i1.p1 TRINITY_DN49517_c0_g1~~TRINITY_DN49517_c0_g1_i1.p1  ORF type:complete len:708 (+),score=80.19 TRINITY_DN49517_c0_g1_i1:90-2213(+)
MEDGVRPEDRQPSSPTVRFDPDAMQGHEDDDQLPGKLDNTFATKVSRSMSRGLTRSLSFLLQYTAPTEEDLNENGELDSDSDEDEGRDDVAVVFQRELKRGVHYTGPFARTRHIVHRLLHSQGCHLISSAIILTNSIAIGLEYGYDAEGSVQDSLHIVELCCLASYVIELLLHLFTDPRKLWKDSWVIFDAAIVFVGVLDLLLTSAPNSALAPTNIIRLLRLCRLARTLRLLRKIRVLWMLVRGLLDSISTMCNTMILLVMVMYIFSCISMEVITRADISGGDPEFEAIVDQYFSTLPMTMLTLLQFVCLDSVGTIYKPLVEHQPGLIVYFAAFILVVPIVMLNVVTGVIVSGAISGAQKDKQVLAEQEERDRKKLMRHLSRIFHNLDGDGSGIIGMPEFMMLREHDLESLGRMTGVSDPGELFRMIDLDESGELSIDEFCDGLWQIVVDKVPLETRRIEKRVAWVCKQMRSVTKAEICLLEAVGELVACQRAFLDRENVPNKLHKNVNAVEKMLLELTSPSKVSRRPSRQGLVAKGKKQPRITGIDIEASSSLSCKDWTPSSGDLFGRTLSTREQSSNVPSWAHDILGELKRIQSQANTDIALASRGKGGRGSEAGTPSDKAAGCNYSNGTPDRAYLDGGAETPESSCRSPPTPLFEPQPEDHALGPNRLSVSVSFNHHLIDLEASAVANHDHGGGVLEVMPVALS